MLPRDILDIIDSYIDRFNYWESLPSVSAIKRLIRKSNEKLMKLMVISRFIPPHVTNPRQFTFIFALTSDNIDMLDRIVNRSIFYDPATSALFWLFIRSQPSIYHGPYARVFDQSSLLHHLINCSAMEISETDYVCLSKSHLLLGYELCRL